VKTSEVGLCGSLTETVIGVMHQGREEKIRLQGIDAPEKKQPFSIQAKLYTASLAFENEVTVKPRGMDRYGRTVADVILPDGRNLNHEIVKAGLGGSGDTHRMMRT
jgi:micrococcal nuclease